MKSFQHRSTYPPTVKVWGVEYLIVNDNGYCGKLMTLKAGWRCSLHYHAIKDEVLMVKSGCVRFELDHVMAVLWPGDSVRVRPGQRHRFTGLSDSEIIEFSTTDDPVDSYRIEPSGRAP